MASIRKINEGARTEENTGFGTISSMYGGRLINRDGRPNTRRTGIGWLDGLSWYHTLIEMPRWKFVFCLVLSFLIANLVFALIYFFIGVEHLGGVTAKTPVQKFIEAYFFSAQTFTTVGYGRINPTGYLTSSMAALEAFTGLLFFALATGLFYARFSRPRSYLLFSDNAIIAPYKTGIAYMIRAAPYKNNYLTDVDAKLTLCLVVEDNGKLMNRFYPLQLELSHINGLSLSWTIVHPINELSPLYKLNKEDLMNFKAEVLVFIKAFDETFSNTVVARTSYTASETIWGAKFLPMYHRSKHGDHTILALDEINKYTEADIGFAFEEKREDVMTAHSQNFTG